LPAVAKSEMAAETAEGILGGEIAINYLLGALVLSKLTLLSLNYVF
jgi:hypothetical protein